MKNWPVCPECCERLYNPAVTKGICSWCKSKSSDGWRFVQCEPLSSHRRTKEEMEFDDKPKGKGGRKKEERPDIKRLSQKVISVNGINYNLLPGVVFFLRKGGIPHLQIREPRSYLAHKRISLLSGSPVEKINQANELARVLWSGYRIKSKADYAEAKRIGDKRYLVDGIEYSLEHGVTINTQSNGRVFLRLTISRYGRGSYKFFKITKKDAAKQIAEVNELSRKMRAEQERNG